MTTVVFDGSMLAADTQSSFHQTGKPHSCPSCEEALRVTHSTARKLTLASGDVKFRDQKVLAWGGSGTMVAIHAFSEALQNNMNLDNVYSILKKANGRLGCDLIIVTDVSCWHLDSSTERLLIEERTQFPVAIGSGQPAAYFACKFLGTTAFGAVGAAIHSDKGTGGNIEYILCRGENGFERKIHKDSWSEQEMRDHIKEFQHE